MVNEGNFKSDPGSINYYKKGAWTLKAFRANNPGKTLGITATNGVIADGKMYVVSMQACFVQAKDGSLWATNEKELVKIDVQNLKVERVVLGDDISVYYDRSFLYRPATLAVSTDGETLLFAKGQKEGQWSIYGKEIWKFDVSSQKATKFYSASSADLSVYGSALKVNPKTGDLYITYTEDGYGTYYLNTAIYIVDGKSGLHKREDILHERE